MLVVYGALHLAQSGSSYQCGICLYRDSTEQFFRTFQQTTWADKTVKNNLRKNNPYACNVRGRVLLGIHELLSGKIQKKTHALVICFLEQFLFAHRLLNTYVESKSGPDIFKARCPVGLVSFPSSGLWPHHERGGGNWWQADCHTNISLRQSCFRGVGT